MSVVVVMGVSGSGKTTVGRVLAARLDVPYAEADDFHPGANIDKMSAGIPLTDEDRRPWLRLIAGWIRDHARGGVISCSALKRPYRDQLRAATDQVRFLHLDGSRSVIAARLAERAGHFMPPALLDSQLADLEPLAPDEPGVRIGITGSPDDIAETALTALNSRPGGEHLAGDGGGTGEDEAG